jgi:PAS domain S-box-containing protein
MHLAPSVGVRQLSTMENAPLDTPRHHELADAAPHLLWMTDESGKSEYANRRAERYRGGGVEQGGWNWTDLVHPDDRAQTLAAWQHALHAAEPLDCEHRLQMADGSFRWHVSRAEPSRDGSGRVIRWIGCATDVHALHRSQARLAELANRMAQLAWMADENGQVYWYNRRWIEYTGKQPEDMLGLGWQSVYHPDHLDALMELVAHSIATDEPLEGTFPLRRHDGCFRWFLFRAMPVRDDDGRVHWFGTATDVDRQYLAEQGLRDADRRKDEFLSMLAHELRNPLAPIRNSVHILRMPAAPEHARAQALLVIDRQVAHLVRLIDDLLDVARIVRGRIELQPQTEDLCGLVRQAIDDFQAGRGEDRPRLSLHCPAGSLAVHCDRTRIIQVIDNLLSNAVKFTPPDGDVSLTLRASDAWAEIIVADSGEGIAPELLGEVFSPFSQGTQALARRSGGLGLGLSLVKGIVDLHGGRVEVDSDGPGKGTRVVVGLPRD